jgi:hypothetical protein
MLLVAYPFFASRDLSGMSNDFYCTKNSMTGEGSLVNTNFIGIDNENAGTKLLVNTKYEIRNTK